MFKLGDVHWDRYLKRYVWDDDTTPYLVPVSRLTRRQASYELTAYAVFLGFLFGVLALVTLAEAAPGGRSPGMSLYSFTMVCAAVLLGTTRHYHAALWCSTAPPAALVWLYVFAHHPGLGNIDHVVIVVFALLWIRYGLRVIAITRRYEAMPPGDAPPPSSRRWGRRRR
jgi:hypothetical protein